MGAEYFSEFKIGTYKSANEAFNELLISASYENGHCGYTGSIAEKSYFKMVDLPKRTRLPEFLSKADEIDGFWQDKWGPAACVELKGRYLTEVKQKYGYRTKKNIRAFFFFGYASS